MFLTTEREKSAGLADTCSNSRYDLHVLPWPIPVLDTVKEYYEEFKKQQ